MILGMLDEVGGHPPSLPLLKDSDSENRPTSSRECVFRFYLIPIPCQNLRLWQDSLKALSRKHAVHWGAGNISLFRMFVFFSAEVKLWNICQDVASSIPWSMGASIFTTEGRELNRLVSAEDWVCVPCLETLLFNARSLQNTQKNARSLAFHPAKWEMSKICRHLIPAAHWCLTWWTFPAGHIFPLQGRPPGGEDLLALSHRKGEAGIWKKQLSYQLDANAFRYPLGIYWILLIVYTVPPAGLRIYVFF